MENLENKPLDGNNQGEEEFLSLAEIWALIWNHKKWYVVSVVICVFFAAFYIYRTSPTYSRTAKVIIDDSNENSTLRDLASFTGGMSRYRTSGMSNVYNEIEAFSSPDIMSTVIQKLGLETSYREKQFLRSRELFQNSPVTVLQAGDNHVSAYSFELTKSGDSTFVLKKFRVAGKDVDELDETVEGRLRDTLDTPVGKLVVLPSMVYADWKKPKPIYVSWVSPRRLPRLIRRVFQSHCPAKNPPFSCLRSRTGSLRVPKAFSVLSLMSTILSGWKTRISRQETPLLSSMTVWSSSRRNSVAWRRT